MVRVDEGDDPFRQLESRDPFVPDLLRNIGELVLGKEIRLVELELEVGPIHMEADSSVITAEHGREERVECDQDHHRIDPACLRESQEFEADLLDHWSLPVPRDRSVKVTAICASPHR